MRSETGIIKIFRDGFYLEVLRFKKDKSRCWTAKISNKKKKPVKEFFGPKREFVIFKALVWIATQKLITFEELVEKFNLDDVKNL